MRHSRELDSVNKNTPGVHVGPPVLRLNYGGAVSRYLAVLKRTKTQSGTRMVLSSHVSVRLDDVANSRAA